MNKTNRSTETPKLQFGSNSHLFALIGSGKLNLSTAAKKRQVLLIGNGNAFADGIMNLLSRQNNLSTKKEFYTDDDAILKDVVLNQPDVVVLISNHSMNLENIVDMLMSTYMAAHLRLVMDRIGQCRARLRRN